MQPMRQFIQPDFQAEQQPRLDWMPWEQPPAQQEGGGIAGIANMFKKGDKAAAVAGTAGKAAGATGAGLGAASL